jgi:uncharacterized protein
MLQIGNGLSLGLNFLEHRKVVFGGSGAGKTAFGRTLFEEATKAGVVCGAIDLKADWWGLKSTADGKGAGIPVVIFGGEHQDVPLDEHGGATTADIVVDLRQPFILDLEHFSKRKQMIFLAAFAERLYDRNREPLVMFWDEVDRYAPQKPMSPEGNICLGAMEDVAKRGRKHGIFSVFITQRNASLNKSVSELCDVSVVFRTPGPRDQEAVQEWFSTKATREQRDEVMAKLAGLETGEAVVCSAHPTLKLFQTVRMRLPWTFDSSATPEIGRRKIEPKQLAKPDLEKIRERMAATIERAKAEDPKEMRNELNNRLAQLSQRNKRIAELEAEVEALKAKPAAPALSDAQITAFERLLQRIERLHETMGALPAALAVEGTRIATALQAVRTPASPDLRQEPVAYKATPATPSAGTHLLYDRVRQQVLDSTLTNGQQRILDTIKMLRTRGIVATRETVARWMGIHPNGGRFNSDLKWLKDAHYIDNHLSLLTAGEQAAATLLTGVDALKAALPENGMRQIVDLVLHSHGMTRDELAQALGIHPNGGRFNSHLKWLRDMGVIPERGLIQLTEGAQR